MGFLFFRSNPELTFLKPFGFNAVALPVATLRPTNTLLRTTDTELTLFGDLETVVTGDARPPSVSTDNVAPSNVNGVQSSSLDLKAGLSVLGNVLKAFTGTSMDVNDGFKKNKSVTFEY